MLNASALCMQDFARVRLEQRLRSGATGADAVLAALSGHQLGAATALAAASGDVRLATLLSQVRSLLAAPDVHWSVDHTLRRPHRLPLAACCLCCGRALPEHWPTPSTAASSPAASDAMRSDITRATLALVSLWLALQ